MRRRILLTCLALFSSCYSAAGVQAQAIWQDGLEGPTATWREGGGDAQHHLDFDRRVQGNAHSGQWSEQMRIEAGAGTYIYLEHDAGPALVVTEISPRLWLRADRTGLQIIARVVLPRTPDPRTGVPIATFVRGTTYTQVGAWQQLRIDDVPTLLARQARVLRSQLGPNVDVREAYIDRLMVNAYGGQGVTNLAIDDLEIAGYVPRPSPTLAQAVQPLAPAAATAAPPITANVAPPPTVRQVSSQTPIDSPLKPGGPTHSVKLAGPVLLVDGHPIFPRIIDYQGEPLSFLKDLGFNAIHLSTPPSRELLAESARLDLWIVCPAPSQFIAGDGSTPGPTVGPEYDPVLVFDLGEHLISKDLEATAKASKQLHLADSRRGRPLIGGADTDLRAFSRHIDLLVAARAALGTSMDLAEYQTWLQERPQLARPGTPMWTIIQTQLSPRLPEQDNVLAGRVIGPVPADEESLRLLVHTVVAAGVRGIMFQSQTPLTETDPQTRLRALTLERINQELDLMEPWAAAGIVVTTASTSSLHLSGTILQTERAHLLLPTRNGPGDQQVPRETTGKDISFVVPGIPDSDEAYELTPAGVQPLRHKRVTGGMQVTLDEFGLSSMVVMTADPQVIAALTQRVAKTATKATELERELAARKLMAVQTTWQQLSAVPLVNFKPNSPTPSNLLATAKSELDRADRLLTAGDRRSAYFAARAVSLPLGQLQRLYWDQATTPLVSPVASPLTASFFTLPEHFRLIANLRQSKLGPNLLAGGDCENLDTMLQAGWQHYEHPQAGIKTDVELTPLRVFAGQACLRLRARPSDPENSNVLVESPPVWVVTAPVPVEAGELLCIRGHVRIRREIHGSVDGLLIIDSLTGEALADRCSESKTWKEFVLYRGATSSGTMTLTFALTGLGEVWLDDLSICRVERPTMPAVAPSLSGRPLGPLLVPRG